MAYNLPLKCFCLYFGLSLMLKSSCIGWSVVKILLTFCRFVVKMFLMCNCRYKKMYRISASVELFCNV